MITSINGTPLSPLTFGTMQFGGKADAYESLLDISFTCLHRWFLRWELIEWASGCFGLHILYINACPMEHVEALDKRWQKNSFLVFQSLPVCRQKPNVLIVRWLFFYATFCIRIIADCGCRFFQFITNCYAGYNVHIYCCFGYYFYTLLVVRG